MKFNPLKTPGLLVSDSNLKISAASVKLLLGIGLFLIASCFSQQSYAAGRAVDVWRSSESSGHYFLRNYGTNTWTETINCQTSFTFTPTKIAADEVQLYDANRKMSVALTATGLYIWNASLSKWDLYRTGKFDPRFLFYHTDAARAVHNFFSLKNGCVWEETTGFKFKETAIDQGAVTMYDFSRNIYVKLTDVRMFMRQGAVGAFNFFHTGEWQ